MPTMYNCSKATDPRPYVSLDAMWTTFSDLAHNKTPAVNGENVFSVYFFDRCAVFRPVGAPGPPVMGAAWVECRPSCFCGSRDRLILPLSGPSMIPPTIGSTRRPTACH